MSGDERILFTVPEGISDERADKVLAAHFTEFSRAQIQRTFFANQVELNGEVINKNARVETGDELGIVFLHPKKSELTPVEMEIEVLHEDDDLLIINKRSGIVVHPGNGTGEDTLVHGLLHYTKGDLSMLSGEDRPGVVHRLDKETSGAIVFTKTDKAYLEMVKKFSEREVEKEYLALVSGSPELDSGRIMEPIGRNPSNRVKMAVRPNGREAHTDWAVEARYGGASLIRCWLHTGRTHQIRVHMQHIKLPLLGDFTYGYKFRPEHKRRPERVMLHAEKLAFDHPISGKRIEVHAELDEDLKLQIAALAE